MTRHPLAKPTVYVDSVPALRLRRAAARLVGSTDGLRRVLSVMGVLVAAVGALGLFTAHTMASDHGTDAGAAVCQDEAAQALIS